MPGQFLLNILIALLWVFLNDEEGLRFTTFVGGYLIGIAVLYLMHRFFGTRFYLARFFSLIKLVFIFISELIKSSWLVISHILRPKLQINPGIFKYGTELRGDFEVTALALLLILTPGTVIIEVSMEGDAFYVHAMDMQQSREALTGSLNRFEKAIMEVTR